MDLYLRFRRFLEERGGVREFEEAFGSQLPGYRLDAVLWEIMGGDECFLGRAFDWEQTSQGRSFWAQVDKEWYSLCSSL